MPHRIAEAHEIIPRVRRDNASHLGRVVLRDQRARLVLVPAVLRAVHAARVQVARTARRVAATGGVGGKTGGVERRAAIRADRQVEAAARPTAVAHLGLPSEGAHDLCVPLANLLQLEDPRVVVEAQPAAVAPLGILAPPGGQRPVVLGAKLCSWGAFYGRQLHELSEREVALHAARRQTQLAVRDHLVEVRAQHSLIGRARDEDSQQLATAQCHMLRRVRLHAARGHPRRPMRTLDEASRDVEHQQAQPLT
mmetsp:Transcript_24946/g.53888  ORF Transcript_24946/g.53888 Transcript_24946/m.53888 type:complete len:252 (+) Transcript_24946:425-1180(+)|eukprot:CAMPEP_0183338912 /NCGR_PEP_ID=MMETSP0164_2-20130417/6036_1 /TAXON_ID=221442 /ORGANISM="Coccolithus pelagicus ssp braarudi, Strain PLY182g" /LENGTH=251 /DNA_ID=CAMNT_0025508833 /DNA_START=425 /DNA_END=1180 /DNA_ORIENTATION=+